MDDLDRREAFLLAIFANPADDLPRLVFADWLEENGDCEWAHRIRTECHQPNGCETPDHPLRGFSTDSRIVVSAAVLADPDELRRVALLEHPEWYGCTSFKVSGGKIASSKPIGTILHSPVTQRVAKLDLSGAEVLVGEISEFVFSEDDNAPRLIDFEYRPTVTLQAVESLVSARECRRFTHLDLRHNDLDNDAARAILRSNYLTRLESLRLFDGNQLRGRTWGQLCDKFGEEVVS